MRDSEERIRSALGEIEIPDSAAAEERAWNVIRAGYAERPRWRRPSPLRRHVLQLAVLAALLAALISPAGAAVRHWVAAAVRSGREPSRPALTSLPARGSLLVQSAAGPWIVRPDGSKRLLGDYSGATWSPHGLYVATTSPRQLAALDPAGEVRWTLGRNGPVRLPSWNAPDGYRIAYLSGDSLRVIDGDGNGDHLLRSRAASVAPAWRPGSRYILSFAKPNGGVESVRADNGDRVFATAPGAPPRFLQWSRDGRRLLIVRSDSIQLRDGRGQLLWSLAAPAGARVLSARLAPGGDRVALILSGAGRSRLLLSGPGGPTRTLFAGPGRFSSLEWSPDGHWILLAWQSADQWFFLAPRHPGRIVAISNIARQFNPGARTSVPAGFPRVLGWCCGP